MTFLRDRVFLSYSHISNESEMEVMELLWWTITVKSKGVIVKQRRVLRENPT